ncbi:MAG: MotA/TolQ/ExbB proton channel family protein [Verrucomicrobiia bacterium]|jgi:hypothetical protein
MNSRSGSVGPLFCIGAAALGGLIAAGGWSLGDPWCGAGWAWRHLRWCYERMGIVTVGLLPLGIWAVRLIIQQLSRRHATGHMELDYAYIARSATILGLIGTIIALGAAGRKLAADIAAGTSSAIIQVVPLTGQALVCTMVGLIIALAAETGLHFAERKEWKNEQRTQ